MSATSTVKRVQEIASDAEFDQKVKGEKGVVLVDFYADWCKACKTMEPILEEIAGKYESVKFFKVNADNADCSSCCKDVRLLPTFRFFKGGEYKSQVGPNKSHILENLENLK